MADSIAEILDGKKTGKVKLKGWIHNSRSSGGITFVEFRDGTGFIQATAKKDKVGEQNFKGIGKLPVQSAIEIEGEAKEDKRAANGYEISIEKVNVISEAQGDYPITQKPHGMKFLLDNRHLSLRNRKINAVMAVREKVLDYSRQWLKQNGFREMQSPVLTAMSQEGGTKLFEVKYFDKKAHLSQSWQLYGEAIMYGFGKVFTVWPTFSAEESRTRKHLSEFWQLEVEIPFCDFDNVMKIEHEFVSFVMEKIAENCKRELAELGRNPEDIKKMIKPFKEVTYDEAIETLRKDNMKIKWGSALGADEEDTLTKHFDAPFFLTRLPKDIVAFYHKEDSENSKVTLSGDLFAPGGYGNLSFCGAGVGERIDDEKELLKRMKEFGIKPDKYQWYVDLRKWGSVQHSGFAIGIERMVMWLCGLKNIRNATLFPRAMNRINP